MTRCQSAAVPGAAVEARLQGGGGRGAGQRKPSTNGKHTSPHRSDCSLYHSREVAGVQEVTGVQKRVMI